MKLFYWMVLSIIFCVYSIQAQEARPTIDLYKFKLFEEKRLVPFSIVKMNLEIETKEGKFPATLCLMENMVYKLEMQTKKTKSIEFVDNTKYLLLTSEADGKKHAEANSELYFRKKYLLNFYPFLHDKPEYPMKEIQLGTEMMNGVEAAVASTEPMPPPVEEVEDPAIKKFIQILLLNEVVRKFYLNIKTMEIVKLETQYYDNGSMKKELILYGKSIRSPEGYLYPSKFTTVFGEATVKSIQFNPKTTASDLKVDF